MKTDRCSRRVVMKAIPTCRRLQQPGAFDFAAQAGKLLQVKICPLQHGFPQAIFKTITQDSGSLQRILRL